MYRYVVLGGAGRQGVAIAYDLARHGEASHVALVDPDERALAAAARRLRRLAPRCRFVPHAGDARAFPLGGFHAAVSALPYPRNPAAASAAVAARVHFCDLGGNTDVVREELKLHARARRAGVAVVPDCGLAPGLSNVLAAIAVEETPGARDVSIRCGGLPLEPRGPLGYSLLFSIGGLTNEYTGDALVLRRGRIARVAALSELEPFSGPPPFRRCEAFATSGGTSTAPETFRGRLRSYEYKTVRYAGHCEKVRVLAELGMFGLEPVDGCVPRDVFHAVAGPRLLDPRVRDAVILRVDCTNARGDGVRYQLVAKYDARSGFTAMERTTGYAAAAIAWEAARGAIAPGARTPERAGLGQEHVRALRRRGLAIRRLRVRGASARGSARPRGRRRA